MKPNRFGNRRALALHPPLTINEQKSPFPSALQKCKQKLLYLLSKLHNKNEKELPEFNQNYNCRGVISVHIIFIFRRCNKQTYTTIKPTLQQLVHHITSTQRKTYLDLRTAKCR